MAWIWTVMPLYLPQSTSSCARVDGPCVVQDAVATARKLKTHWKRSVIALQPTEQLTIAATTSLKAISPLEISSVSILVAGETAPTNAMSTAIWQGPVHGMTKQSSHLTATDSMRCTLTASTRT